MMHLFGLIALGFVLLNTKAFVSGLVVGVILGHILHKIGVV